MWTPSGRKPIETLQQGDEILIFNQRDRAIRTSRVHSVVSRVVPLDLVTLAGENVASTREHLFFVEGSGWVAAGELTPTDRVVAFALSNTLSSPLSERVHPPHVLPSGMAANASSSKALGLARVPIKLGNLTSAASAMVEVFNVFAEDTHTYFVGESGLLVHACLGMNIGPLADQVDALEGLGLSGDATVMTSVNSSDGAGAGADVGTEGLVADAKNAVVAAGKLQPMLVVLDSFAPLLSILLPTKRTQSTSSTPLWSIGTLACVGLSDWAAPVGQRGDALVVLDHTKGVIVGLSRAGLRDVVDGKGEVQCNRTALVSWTVTLAARQANGSMPTRAALGENGSIYVAYFEADVIEHYWVPSLAVGRSENNEVRLVSHFALPKRADGRHGASAVAVCGRNRDRLCVTHSAFRCDAVNCTKFSYGSSMLVVLTLNTATGAIVGEEQQLALPLVNPSALHRHGTTGSLVVAFAGDRDAQAGGVQRLVEDDDGKLQLGPLVELPLRADATRVLDLDETRVAVMCFSHDHLFVIDTATNASHLTSNTWRFDGSQLQPVAPTALGTRTAAALHDIVRIDATHVVLLDGKHSRLVTVRMVVSGVDDEAAVRLEVMQSVKVAGLNFANHLLLL